MMNTAVRRDGSVMVREVDGEILVLDTLSNQVHQLNRTASFIWRQCGGALSPDEIATALTEAFAVDGATALDDVVKTLDQLRSLNLLDLA